MKRWIKHPVQIEVHTPPTIPGFVSIDFHTITRNKDEREVFTIVLSFADFGKLVSGRIPNSAELNRYVEDVDDGK